MQQSKNCSNSLYNIHIQKALHLNGILSGFLSCFTEYTRGSNFVFSRKKEKEKNLTFSQLPSFVQSSRTFCTTECIFAMSLSVSSTNCIRNK